MNQRFGESDFFTVAVVALLLLCYFLGNNHQQRNAVNEKLRGRYNNRDDEYDYDD